MALARLQPQKLGKRPAPPSENRKQTIGLFVAVAVVAVVAAIYYWPENLISLNVKDADVQEVVRAVSRKSGQTILVSSDAKGAVTINVRKKSVPDILEIITNQLGGRWQEFYAVSDTTDSIGVLKKSLTEGGEAKGWRLRGFGWGAADGDEFDWIPTPDKITYEAATKPARDIALALSLRMRSRVVVSESIGEQSITLVLKDKTPANAVSDLARQLNATTERFFSLRLPSARQGGPPEMTRGGGEMFIPDAAGGGAPQMRGRGGNPNAPMGNRSPDGAGFRPRNRGTSSPDAASLPASATLTEGAPANSSTTTESGTLNAPPILAGPPNRGGGFGNFTEADRERFRADRQTIQAERESAWQARLAAMPPEQRARAEELRATLTQFRQQAREMTRDQRTDAMRVIVTKFPELVDKRLERSLERIKTTTPEQRAERAQTNFERQKDREQRQETQQPPTDIPPSSR